MTDVTVVERPSFLPRSLNEILDRSDRLAAMSQLVDAGLTSLSTHEGWSAYLSGLARFPHLSPANIFLVAAQRPAATMLRTHAGWAALERTPLERGIAILIPSVRHVRHNGRAMWDGGRPVTEEVRQRPGTVFDYSQTAGAHFDRPWTQHSMSPPPGFVDDLRAAAASIGYAVEARRAESSGTRRVFALIHGQDEREHAFKLARELGTAAGGRAGSELFAYALCSANGMLLPPPALPADPEEAALSARRGLRRVLQRTAFRHMV